MSGFALHPEAYSDIDEIRDQFADQNPNAADRMVTEIFDTIRALVPFPHQGFRRPNLTSRPSRFKLIREYVIVYAPDKAQCGSSPYSTVGAAPASWLRSFEVEKSNCLNSRSGSPSGAELRNKNCLTDTGFAHRWQSGSHSSPA